ncbi:MAG: succinate dehydrogenase cytochrome b subunit [Verrucomicrobia bacterium]|nr:succinate dehydrogenase cytochrome b subunit [Verrucomicrobiota bacterium]MCH8514325.1 succinate dehydrogenase cytochrome b subunit [Kiritimatiellia bacterium]
MINPKDIHISSVIKKLLTGITGLSLVMFLIAHLIGNLTLFAGPEVFNAYAQFLHHFMHGMFIRFAEIGLLGMFLIHIWSAVSVQMSKKKARPSRYAVEADAGGASKKTFHSLNMLVSGGIILLFVLVHLNHFKYADHEAIGTMRLSNGVEAFNAYKLVVGSFQANFGYVLFYMLAMAVLCSHLMHGIWSAFQSIGFTRPSTLPYLNLAGKAIAIALALGFFLLPLLIFMMRGTFDPNLGPETIRHAANHFLPLLAG